MASFTDRMIRAAKLDVNLYEEVEADKGAMGQAMAVVVLASVAAGIGTIGTIGIMGLVLGTLAALLGWFIWAFLTYFIGTRLLPEPQTKADYGELLRTIGFSSSPGVLRVLGIIPALGGILNFLIGIWMLVAMVIAVRQALDYKSTWRAVGVCLIGWIIQIAILALVAGLFGGFGTLQA
ncbi:MAG: YIP1 family protein [Desulfobacterales bacterium]